MDFGDFVLGGNEKSNSNSRKSLVKSLLSESMEGYHSQENQNVVDLEYNETPKKLYSEKSDSNLASMAEDSESEHSLSDGTYHRSFISKDEECNDCQSQFVRLKIPAPDQ